MSEKRTSKTVPLGSGNVYVAEFDGALPSISELITSVCVTENKYGSTTGGATLTYTATKHEEKDDFGVLSRCVTTDETAKMGWGVFSWAPEMLGKLVATAESKTEDGYYVTRIGGLENDDGKSYIVVFEHVDKKYGNLYAIIVGTNTADLSIAFKKDDTSKLQPEFTAEPQDERGTLILIAEKAPEETQTKTE